MFVELMPLLAGRTVMITVAREDEKTLRVNVIPRKAKEDENPALSTRLSYTGTPAQAKAEMEAAAKAAQEEARKKAAERNKKPAEKTATTTDSNPTTPAQVAEAVVPSGTLFGSPRPAEPTGATKPTGGDSTCKLAL